MAKAKKDKRDKLLQIRERVKQAFVADRKNRQSAMEDLKFVNVPGEQWDSKTRQERGERPCYEFNKLRISVKRVVNDMRANRPSGKVRGTEEGDKDTAEIYEGLIRNIWNVSDADTVIDAAAEFQVTAGMGAWRVSVDYSDDSAFEQDIKIEGIRNPFCLYPDPACHDPLKRDARYWVLISRISKTAFEAKYPKADVVDFDSDTQFDDDDEWEDEDSVRIVEYWYREPVKKVIHQLQDGRVVDNLEDPEYQLNPVPVLKSREVMSHRIAMCIASGDAILEEAEWAGSQFPFIVVYGENMVIDGENRWWGLPRFAKDPQKAYNYSRTSAIETVALTPQAKWWATPTQANGHTERWGEAHKKNYPFMLYNPDQAAPGAPQAMPGANVPAALVTEMQISSDDIKATTGIFDASIGNKSNETSGVAIDARTEQGEIATFNYMDNHAKGIRRTWEILVDLIPKIYDTERSVRVLGVDGSEKYAIVNQAGLNDLSRGKYDVAITVGPSFATQRQQASEIYSQLAQRDPALSQIAGDLIYKAMDLPYSNEIAERYKAILPPPIQQMIQGGQGVPPEVAQGMAQVDQAMQMVQQQGMMVQQGMAELQQQDAELQKKANDLKVAEANFKAMVAEKMAGITTAEAGLTASQAKAGTDAEGQAVAQDRESLSIQVQQAVLEIRQEAAAIMQQALALITQMQQTAQPQVVVADPPKRKRVEVSRINGKLVGEVVEVA
jgi:hypothetical protein